MSNFNKAMLLLANQPNAIFLGQNVKYGGVAMYKDLEGIQDSQRLEFPVAEELQLGVSIGLSLQGFLPISVFPRIDFLLRAADQLINHLDKLNRMSVGQFTPKVIIRTRVGAKTPLNAGPQHTNDHTEAFKSMLNHTIVAKITNPDEILSTYQKAINFSGSTLVVEAIS